MNSNYYFQKQQADERIQARMQEAENHRLSKQGNGGSPFSFLMNLTFPLMLLGISIAILLLAGCTVGDVLPEQTAGRTENISETTMVERIHFQDARETKLEVDRENAGVREMAIAARIAFQDKRDGYLIEKQVVEPRSDWTMAERIRFHDRIQEQYP